MITPSRRQGSGAWPSRGSAAFMAVTLFLLLSEHRAHALGWVLHLLVGACVLLLYLHTRACEGDGSDADGSPR